MHKTEEVTKFESVCAILKKYDYNPQKLVTILQEVQDEYRYLPEDVITYVATALGVTSGMVFGVATFYSHFTLEPKGKYIIKVCDGTACHVRKSQDIINAIAKELGLPEGQSTTEDMLFTLDAVACIGACGLAPVLLVNEDVHGSLTKETSVEVIKKYIEEEAAANE